MPSFSSKRRWRMSSPLRERLNDTSSLALTTRCHGTFVVGSWLRTWRRKIRQVVPRSARAASCRAFQGRPWRVNRTGGDAGCAQRPNCDSSPSGRRSDRIPNSFDLPDVRDRLVAAKLWFGANQRRLFGMVCHVAYYRHDGFGHVLTCGVQIGCSDDGSSISTWQQVGRQELRGCARSEG